MPASMCAQSEPSVTNEETEGQGSRCPEGGGWGQASIHGVEKAKRGSHILAEPHWMQACMAELN